MGTPHKWADVIKAMVDGIPVQLKSHPDKEWTDWEQPYVTPFNVPEYEWRIKPDPKPDVEMYFELAFLSAHARFKHQKEGEELKLVFDGETGKFKSAEVVK